MYAPLSKRAPWAANASRWGVAPSGLPATPRVSARCWSVVISKMLGGPFIAAQPVTARTGYVLTSMETLRTPDECFAALPDFPFAPNYTDVPDGEDGTLRVHFLDEGPPDGEVVLLMHGEPSWSFLYRTMIPVLVDAGLRCIAPDLVGFGRSDKPTERTDHTYARHVEWMRAALFDTMQLNVITLFGQDWGGLIGLRLVAEHPDRFARVVTANTYLPTGDTPPSDALVTWQRLSQEIPEFTVGAIVNLGCRTDLSEAVVAGYDAPFPDETYKAGARQFPVLIPTSPDDPAAVANRAAWTVLRGFTKPWLTAFSDKDPLTRGGDTAFQREIPGCAGQPHTTIRVGVTSSRKTAERSSRASWPPSSRARRGPSARSRAPTVTGSTTSSLFSTRCAPSRIQVSRTPRTRSTANATNGSSSL